MSSLVKSVVHWGSNPRTSMMLTPDLCEICGKKPKFVEKGFKHPYCSRTCARVAQSLSPNQGNGQCLLTGCRAAGRASVANFCTDAHGREAVRLGQVASCDACKVQPRSVGNLCAVCERRGRAPPPKLRQLNSDATSFKNVRAQFRSEWEFITTLPSVEKVYEIVNSRDILANHDHYRNTNPTKILIRTFHAAQCVCDMGTKEQVLCNFRSCGICCIVKSSFKEFAFGEPHNVGRFGKGIYTYRDPSLADRHATSCTSSPYRVMIACDTLVDQSQCLRSDETNDRESIFIDYVDAILPVYLIMYCK
ncbi:hypothetical protein AX15_003062 [Amanita polypyramis BW_CC]|nr:hypothetical protein AX15_003062 [Amanita polypyramis BW_CC]